jgi:TonB family protein
MKPPTASIDQQALPELHLLVDLSAVEDRGRPIWAGVGSIIVHILIGIAAVGIAQLPSPAPPPSEPQIVDVRKAIPLIAPPTRLTQTQPNRAPVAKEARLDNLLPRPEVRPRARTFSPPPGGRPAPPPSPPAVEVNPQIRIAQAPPPVVGSIPDVNPPPTAKPPEEKPKLAFETPGLPTAAPSGTSHIPAPKTGVQEAVRGAIQNRAGGMSVGDTGAEMPRVPMPGQTPGPPKQASSLDLLSDPMGVDFKPYLIRVLAAVRRNWMAIIPESARLGQRGKVVIQFSIDRSGSVPKLVIAMPSGTDAFDRAAVAGVSASNPFPPLPPEFKGEQIRLQLAFFYNLPTR